MLAAAYRSKEAGFNLSAINTTFQTTVHSIAAARLTPAYIRFFLVTCSSFILSLTNRNALLRAGH